MTQPEYEIVDMSFISTIFFTDVSEITSNELQAATICILMKSKSNRCPYNSLNERVVSTFKKIGINKEEFLNRVMEEIDMLIDSGILQVSGKRRPYLSLTDKYRNYFLVLKRNIEKNGKQILYQADKSSQI